MGIFSTSIQLEQINNILTKYIRLPFFGNTIPGAIMEAILAYVKGADVLNTYDFVDVIKNEERCGWQVKSTKSTTPVTWKRAKIPNQVQLIEESRRSQDGLQNLGNAIINFCNEHALHSMRTYQLDEIGYCRLVIHSDGNVTYFEKLLCNRDHPNIFNIRDVTWQWSTPKKTEKKERLPALHGIHNETGQKWWAWHGLGENQLHFSGESSWWPDEENCHTTSFTLPSEKEKLSLEDFLYLLSRLDNSD